MDAGDISNLLMEGRTIQQRLCGRLPRPCDDLRLARIFANLMFQGKTKAAIRLLMTQSKGCVLHLNDLLPSSDNARNVLIAKHPPGSPADPSILLHTDEGPTTVLFDRIDAVAMRDAALGGAGPSGIDANGWKKCAPHSNHPPMNSVIHLFSWQGVFVQPLLIQKDLYSCLPAVLLL